jgi:hypothetical protein
MTVSGDRRGTVGVPCRLAAERTGRQAYAIEIDPGYVEVAIGRWQDMTGKTARHAETNFSLEELRQQRQARGRSPRRRKKRKGGHAQPAGRNGPVEARHDR